jgi:hypothetical protein
MELVAKGRVNPWQMAAPNLSCFRRMSKSAQTLLQAAGVIIASLDGGANFISTNRIRAANLIRYRMRLKTGS